MYLTKEHFWAASRRLPAEEVSLVDPHGREIGKVRVRGLSADELESYQESIAGGASGRITFRKAMSRLVAMCVINEDGSPFFDKHEVAKLGEAPSWMITQLFQSACRLSGMTESDVQELAGNFDETPGEHSSSD